MSTIHPIVNINDYLFKTTFAYHCLILKILQILVQTKNTTLFVGARFPRPSSVEALSESRLFSTRGVKGVQHTQRF